MKESLMFAGIIAAVYLLSINAFVTKTTMVTSWNSYHKTTIYDKVSDKGGYSRQSRILMSSVQAKSVPARTFIDSVGQAATAVRQAIEDGEKLIEVEFPPLPLEYLEDSSSSARDLSQANTRWAIELGKRLADRGPVSIIYPDQPELEDALAYVNMPNAQNPFPNITLATIRSDSIKNAQSIDQVILSIFGATIGGKVESIPNTAMYVALVSSTQELTDLEKLHNLDRSIPIVFFNLRLDVLVSFC